MAQLHLTLSDPCQRCGIKGHLRVIVILIYSELAVLDPFSYF